MANHPFSFMLVLSNREQHLEKKIEQLTAEAKAKMAKKDKKGKLSFLVAVSLMDVIIVLETVVGGMSPKVASKIFISVPPFSSIGLIPEIQEHSSPSNERNYTRQK